MREIKFRAWDKKSNRMIYIENPKQHPPYIRFQSPTNKPVLVIGEEWELEPTRLVMDIELMQYTGMKDKNGKEIYEGDIVQEVLPNGKYNDAPGVVNIGEFICDNSGDEYAPIACYGVHVTGSDNYWWNRRGEFIPGCVIILGNVYENPDLLGGEKKEEEA